MLRNPRVRQRIKSCLIFLNSLLSGFFLLLLTYGLFVVRQNEINTAMNLGHFLNFDLNNLQNNADTVKPDYLGKGTKHVPNPRVKDNRHISKLASGSDRDEAQEAEDNSARLVHEDHSSFIAQQRTAEVDNGSNTISQEDHYNYEVKIKPKIAIIITNLGLNRVPTELALTLPKQVALGFSPFTSSLKPLLFKSYKKGHEIFLHLPMEAERLNENIEGYALMRHLGNEENTSRLNAILNVQVEYQGLYSNFGEKYTNDLKSSEWLLNQLRDRDLLFVSGKIINHLANIQLYHDRKIAETNIIIDQEVDKKLIKKNLHKLIKYAKEHKYAVGYSQGYALTIEIINKWLLPLLEEEDIELVPISHVMK